MVQREVCLLVSTDGAVLWSDASDCPSTTRSTPTTS